MKEKYSPSRQDSSKTRENTRNSHFLSSRTRVIESGTLNTRKIRVFSVTTGKIALFNIFTRKNVLKVTCVSVFTCTGSYTRVQHLKVYISSVFRHHCYCCDWDEKSRPCFWYAHSNFWSFSHTNILISFYFPNRSIHTTENREIWRCSEANFFLPSSFEHSILLNDQLWYIIDVIWGKSFTLLSFTILCIDSISREDDYERERIENDQVSKPLTLTQPSIRFASVRTNMFTQVWCWVRFFFVRIHTHTLNEPA